MENKTSKVAMNESRIGLDAPLVVSSITENCLYSGFFGRLDSERMKLVTDKMIETIDFKESEYVIIDLSNVEIIDSAIAVHLVKVGTILQLTGVKVIFCGIKGIVAQTMTAIGLEFEKYPIVRDLKGALKMVYELNGQKLVKINSD